MKNVKPKMRKVGVKFAILVNDWGSSNYPTEYEVKAVFDDIKDTKEVLLSVITDYFDEWCYDDYDAEEYLNDVFKAFENHEAYIDHEGEISFKFEEIPLRKGVKVYESKRHYKISY